ncbi:MAG: helix-hairpin-helix domain-containing protein [Candidatus Blackburnbacteria bacterium]|nr:helix-hairpin-helix domain-containing protein [Candidatus Blackburnbacteria bacterium]
MEGETLLQSLEAWLYTNRKLASLVLFGLLFLGVGLFLFRSGVLDSTEVKVLSANRGDSSLPLGMTGEGFGMTVEISGSVLKPGVYHLEAGARIDDLLIMAGGLSAAADRNWVARNLNRAARVSDGQKVYIPKVGEVDRGVGGSGDQVIGVPGNQSLLNLNTASLKELDALPGIGGTRAQGIIAGRPYSSVEELLTRKILPKSVYEKIKGSVIAP